MNFKTYMEQYKNKLTDAKSLSEMLHVAKKNHRVQKLLVAYIMKDSATFNSMLELAGANEYALRLVMHAKITLDKLKSDGYYDTYAMEVLADELRNNIKSLNLNCEIDVEIEKWELDGYLKMLNNFAVQKKMDSLNKQLHASVNNILENIDWDNLITERV